MKKADVKVGAIVGAKSEEELKKKVKKNYVNLKFNAEGHYCDECMKVVSIFDEK